MSATFRTILSSLLTVKAKLKRFLFFSLPRLGREDVLIGAKNARELATRARLRRNVQWMSGVPPLMIPTLIEMDKLMEKVGGALGCSPSPRRKEACRQGEGGRNKRQGGRRHIPVPSSEAAGQGRADFLPISPLLVGA